MDIKKIKEAIKSLPHSSKLNQQDVLKWLTSVGQTDPKRILWHLERASAVGGSEIGTLLLEAQGLTPPFGNTGVQIAREKKLQSAPDRPLPHMLRGILLEKPMIAAMLNIYGGQRDAYAEASVKNGSIEGMKGNCDFYWNLDSKRILVDTKVPINASDPEYIENENYKVFSYKCQLNHYDLLGESSGVSADKLVIAELDVPTVLADKWCRIIKEDKANGVNIVTEQMTILLADDLPGMRINLLEVEKSIQIDLYGSTVPLREAIPTVCQSFMEHLINDSPLAQIEREEELILPTTEEKLNELDSRLGRLRVISEYCEHAITETQENIKTTLHDPKLSLGEYKGTMFGVKKGTKVDMGAAIQTLKRYPIDLDDLRQPPPNPSARSLDMKKTIETLKSNGLIDECLKQPDFDEEKVIRTLNDLGENSDAFIVSDVSIRKSISKLAKERFKDLSELATDIEEYLSIKELDAKHQQTLDAQEELENDTSISMNIA